MHIGMAFKEGGLLVVPIVTIVKPVRRSIFDVMLYWGFVEFVEMELEGLGVLIFLSLGEEKFVELDGRGVVGIIGFDERLLGSYERGMEIGMLMIKHFLRSRFKMNPSIHSIQSFESLFHFVQESFFKM